jgi:hypothetical protein
MVVEQKIENLFMSCHCLIFLKKYKTKGNQQDKIKSFQNKHDQKNRRCPQD